MKFFSICSLSLAFTAVLTFSGCKDTVDVGRGTVPFVEDLLSGQNAGLSLLTDFNPRDSRGSIALIGPFEADSVLAARLLTADDVDNIDGRAVPDGLPDFAGEQIDIIADESCLNIPLSESEELRTAAVRTFMAALDTAFSLGAFDDERLQSKLPAKLVVYTSSINAEAGAFDVDTLCRSTECTIPVVFPSRVVIGQQLDRNIEHLHIAVLTDSLTAASGVYPRIFDEMSRSRGILGTGCTAFYAGSSSDMNSILSLYKASGGNMPISALLIDDRSVNIEMLKTSLEEVLSVQNEANLNSRKLVTRDLTLVDVEKAVADECYRILRHRNIFTHNISYPVSKSFMTVKSSSGDGYNLVEKD